LLTAALAALLATLTALAWLLLILLATLLLSALFLITHIFSPIGNRLLADQIINLWVKQYVPIYRTRVIARRLLSLAHVCVILLAFLEQQHT
jgi:hypothetical protein